MLRILATIGKAIVVFLLLLVAGSFICRQGEVVDVVVKFYTCFSIEEFVMLVLSGFCAGLYFLSKIDEMADKADKSSKKAQKKEEKK